MNETDIKTRRMTVAAERTQLLETLKALCAGKESCEIAASRALLGDCDAADLAAGKCAKGQGPTLVRFSFQRKHFCGIRLVHAVHMWDTTLHKLDTMAH